MSEEGRFADQAVIVTGGAQGMGAACVEILAAEGARVVVLDRDEAAAEDLLQRQAEGGRNVSAEIVDLADEGAFRNAFALAQQRLGGLDVFIQVAGGSRGSLLMEQDLTDWDWHWRQNVRATALGCKLAAAVMAQSGGGAIVNMSSISGLRGDPGWAAYNASKAAIISLTQSLAWEWGRQGIRVNAVCPGPVRSKRMIASLEDAEAMTVRYAQATALGRLVETEEAAKAILFLASGEASAITGTTLVVDCGLTARTGQPV